MKLTLEPNDLVEATKQYLRNNYSIYGEVAISKYEFDDIVVDIEPLTPKTNILNIPEATKNTEEPVDTEREDAINRADHLGIKYRADISTEKLIERIEEHEEEILRLATEEKENFPEDELFPTFNVGEIHAGNVGELKVESDEPLEEVVSDETIEAEETQPEKKKKSIFAKD